MQEKRFSNILVVTHEVGKLKELCDLLEKNFFQHTGRGPAMQDISCNAPRQKRMSSRSTAAGNSFSFDIYVSLY